MPAAEMEKLLRVNGHPAAEGGCSEVAVKGRLPTTAADSLLSVQQAAELLGVSQATVRNWAKPV